MCLVVLLSPHWVTLRSLLIVSNHCPCACVWRVQVTCTLSTRLSVIYVVINFPARSVGHCSFCFFSRAYGCTVLLDPFISVVQVSAATLRLQNSAGRAQIWSSWYLNLVDRFLFVISTSAKYVPRAAVVDAKFMKASSISPYFAYLVLPYPVALAICSSSSLSRYAYWKCSLNRTHVRLLDAMLFHMQY